MGMDAYQLHLCIYLWVIFFFFCIIGLLVFGLGHCFDYKVLCLMNPLLVEICLGYFLHCFCYIVSL